MGTSSPPGVSNIKEQSMFDILTGMLTDKFLIYKAALTTPAFGSTVDVSLIFVDLSDRYFLALFVDESDFKFQASLSILFLKGLSAHLVVVADVAFFAFQLSRLLSDRNDSQLVCDTILKAVLSRNPRKGLIFHSDRGSNFCSKETRRLLIANGIRRSNSRKGNCWDNAVAESFFSSLKREIEYNTFYNIEEAEHLLFDFIEVYYNRFRFHSTLGYINRY